MARVAVTLRPTASASVRSINQSYGNTTAGLAAKIYYVAAVEFLGQSKAGQQYATIGVGEFENPPIVSDWRRTTKTSQAGKFRKIFANALRSARGRRGTVKTAPGKVDARTERSTGLAGFFNRSPEDGCFPRRGFFSF